MMKSYILSSIDWFIENRKYPYALLINGGWGCGKMNFVMEEPIPHIRENRENKEDINCGTLYGVKSADEISQRMLV